MPLFCTPGPTNPTHVLPISFWKSPWFQAKPGLAQVVKPTQPPERFVVWKKKSALPNMVKVGVRLGSELIICSVFSSAVSARRCAIGVGPPAYGSTAVAFETSRSSLRTDGSVRPGPFWPAAPLT